MIKIILKENKRQLLNEITLDQAIASVTSKATRRLIYQYIKKEKEEAVENGLKNNPTLSREEIISQFKNNSIEPSEQSIYERNAQMLHFIINSLPRDIEEKEKGLAIVWMKNILLKDYNSFYEYFPLRGIYHHNLQYNMHKNLERFFQMKRFVEPKEKQDLNKVESFEELEDLIIIARPKYQTWQEKQAFLNADKGTEHLGQRGNYDVYIAHNKGAACKLGKGTDWCTAAPGLDYFKHYYREDDPLFIFINKNDPTDKFQFHYGSKQFMDKNDQPLKPEYMFYLHRILTAFGVVQERYPKVMNFKDFPTDESGEWA